MCTGLSKSLKEDKNGFCLVKVEYFQKEAGNWLMEEDLRER